VQYFVWYFAFLPFVIASSRLTLKQTAVQHSHRLFRSAALKTNAPSKRSKQTNKHTHTQRSLQTNAPNKQTNTHTTSAPNKRSKQTHTRARAVCRPARCAARLAAEGGTLPCRCVPRQDKTRQGRRADSRPHTYGLAFLATSAPRLGSPLHGRRPGFSGSRARSS
jgi:hypothetical protein